MNDLQVCWWPIERPRDYPKNARKWSAQAVEKVGASLRAYGFRQPVVVDRDEVIIIGHLRRAAARKEGFTEIPVHVAHDLTPAQVRGLRLMDNRSHEEADWDIDLLGPELEELRGLDFDLSLTGFDEHEIDDFLSDPGDDDRANLVPALPEHPTAQTLDVWLLGSHRLICGDCTQADVVAKLLGAVRPLLMVTDPPYGIELDTEWRDRAGLNSHPGKRRSALDKVAAQENPTYPAEPSYMRTEGHTVKSISGDTIADWSHAFELVPSLQVAYVWHASKFTREVLDGLLRIGFLHHQQIIWNKLRTVLTRTHYWFQHEPCWYVRKKNAPWFGKAGDNSTVWDSPSPKFIMGGSKEEKFDHPTQKPIELMRRPILNHIKRDGVVYDPFLGSGTTLIAAELTGRTCYGVELDPKYVDVICQRFMDFSGKPATLEAGGRTFEQIKAERLGVAA
ncbi:MAG: DNA modification methylase [Acidobacteriia bacterium]|nr:DNA modification methylase [Terriglobia bacterium]